MSKYIVDGTKLDLDMKRVADSIRAKSGGGSKLDWPDGFISEINNISTASSVRPPEADINPNTRKYDDTLVATFTLNNVQDVTNFCNKYNHDNNYYGGIDVQKWEYYCLRPGMRIRIMNDSIYDEWMIAGFDLEYKQRAADGTIYDNGYGIALIPASRMYWTHQWNNWIDYTKNGYLNSEIHKYLNTTISSKLKKTFGNHLIERNVLLSDGVDSSYHANSYTWTKAYATLLSIGQITGEFNNHTNKYDDGEATYKLPVFNYTEFKTGYNFWSRGIYDDKNAWYIRSDGAIYGASSESDMDTFPLIYIR